MRVARAGRRIRLRDGRRGSKTVVPSLPPSFAEGEGGREEGLLLGGKNSGRRKEGGGVLDKDCERCSSGEEDPIEGRKEEK